MENDKRDETETPMKIQHFLRVFSNTNKATIEKFKTSDQYLQLRADDI
jgi:hypothetical protein